MTRQKVTDRMKQITVIFDEQLHHVCLTYGVKQAFTKMPFLNRKIVETGGKTAIINNFFAPPPTLRNPERGTDRTHYLVSISYWKERLTLMYHDEACTSEEITAFAENLIMDYLHYRHPFMKVAFEEGKAIEKSSGHKIAETII